MNECNTAINLSAPWETYVRKITRLFRDDKDVEVIWNEEEKTLVLHVNNEQKANALMELLPGRVEFGSVSITVNVVPSNDAPTMEDFFRWAFSGNDAISYIYKASGISSPNWLYVVFKPEVVQFFNDDLSDVYGNETTLMEDIARDIFPDADACFCTDQADDKPTERKCYAASKKE